MKKGSLRSYRGAWERFQKFICGWGTSTYEKMAGAQEEERVGGDLARVASFLGHSEGSRSTVVYVKPRSKEQKSLRRKKERDGNTHE